MGRPKDGSANQIKGACGYEEECKKSRTIQKKGDMLGEWRDYDRTKQNEKKEK